METRDIATARVRLCVAEAGDGDPLLVLHGFTGAKEDFVEVGERLSIEGWHVVIPDQRGHGSSEAPAAESSYSLAALAADAWALLDARGWKRAAVIGHSMGGMVAQLMAIEAPERVDALVLMDTSHGTVVGVDPALVALATRVARTEGMARLVELARQLDTRVPAPAELRSRAERPGHVEEGERKMRACAPAMFAALSAELMSDHDRLDALRLVDRPTLVVVGEQDAAFLGPSRCLAEAIRGARLEVIGDAAHSPQHENPERWWTVVSSFLDAVRPDPSS